MKHVISRVDQHRSGKDMSSNQQTAYYVENPGRLFPSMCSLAK